MGIFDAIKGLSALQEAMEAGKEIKDPAKWKDRQVTANKIAIIIGSILLAAKAGGVEVPVIGNDIIMDIANGIGLLMLAGNAVLTIITTKKIGAKK